MVFWPVDFEGMRDDAKGIYLRPFVEFLIDYYGEEELMERIRIHGSAAQRCWYRWRCENALIQDIGRIDDFLMNTLDSNLMLHDLPANCFAPRRKRCLSRPHADEETKRRAVKAVRSGRKFKEVAFELGYSADSLRKWASEYGEVAA